MGTIARSATLLTAIAGHPAGAPAIEESGGQFSFGELLRLACAIRDEVAACCPAAGCVAVVDDPGSAACASIAAAHALGRAYVPLSPDYSGSRVKQVVAAVEPALIIVSDRVAPRVAHLLPPFHPVLKVSPGTRSVVWLRAPATKAASASPTDSDIAYVMFTSGTSGHPKGVPVRFESLMAYLETACRDFGVVPGDRASHFFDLTFDLSVHDIFVTLLGGGTLVPVPGRQRMLPAHFIRKNRISHWFSVPSVADALDHVGALRPNVFPYLRQSLFCGEPLRWATAAAWQVAAPASRVVNLYGPTEATIAISSFEMPSAGEPRNETPDIVPIGHIFEAQHDHIHPGRAEREATRGELWLSGSQVIMRYLGHEGEDTRKFVRGPDGDSWYRTGDVVERDSRGVLHFIGRLDDQLKVSGYRVEPAEIERVIHQSFPQCRSIVVLCGRGRRQGLVAVLVCGKSTMPSASQVRQACADSLPPYMRPRHVVWRSSWPLNANGKIDRIEVRRQLEEEGT